MLCFIVVCWRTWIYSYRWKTIWMRYWWLLGVFQIEREVVHTSQKSSFKTGSGRAASATNFIRNITCTYFRHINQASIIPASLTWMLPPIPSEDGLITKRRSTPNSDTLTRSTRHIIPLACWPIRLRSTNVYSFTTIIYIGYSNVQWRRSHRHW